MCNNRVMKLSVLVPIYNVEKYLPECLDSLCAQTLKSLEIICINDGSTDASGAILDEYSKNYSNIIVINKKNSGYGDSMNRGLLVPMQSALNAWKIPTFADCFFNLCLFVLFENFGCKNLRHTIFEPLKLLFSLL